MELLVLGGSWFLGRALVETAIGRGWRVTTFTRSPLPFDAAVRTFHGDRENAHDLSRLAKWGSWDAVIDVAGIVPASVGLAARLLRPAARRYVFVSTISAYCQWPHTPVSESSLLWKGNPVEDPPTREWDPEAYGPLKVGCELAAAEALRREQLLIVRPHVLLGPREYVGRLLWWLERAERGGQILVPGPDRFIQPIDVRDVAAFVCDQVEAHADGVVNVAGPRGRDTFADLVRACLAAVGQSRPAELVWVEENWLVASGVRQWTEIPLWRNAAAPWDMDVSRAEGAGLKCRPLAETVADTWYSMKRGEHPVQHERRAEHGLSIRREEALLAAWHLASGQRGTPQS